MLFTDLDAGLGRMVGALAAAVAIAMAAACLLAGIAEVLRRAGRLRMVVMALDCMTPPAARRAGAALAAALLSVVPSGAAGAAAAPSGTAPSGTAPAGPADGRGLPDAVRSWLAGAALPDGAAEDATPTSLSTTTTTAAVTPTTTTTAAAGQVSVVTLRPPGRAEPSQLPHSPSLPPLTAGAPAVGGPEPGSPYVVQPRDSLWRIAARGLGPGSSTQAVARAWPAIYAANRAVIGPDPDLIRPGIELTLPPFHTLGPAGGT